MFGAVSSDPSPSDLAGLLIGTGQLTRMGGTARISVVVAQAWRVHVLMHELTVRRLAPTWEPVDLGGGRQTSAGQPADLGGQGQTSAGQPADLGGEGQTSAGQPADLGGEGQPVMDEAHGEPDGGKRVSGEFSVRTAYTGLLAPLGAAWTRVPAAEASPRSARLVGAAKVPPPGFGLDGVRLRLWFAAAGQLNADDSEVILRLGPNDEACWAPAQRALRQLGIDSEQVKGPAIKITGRRRLRRFAELIGDHPHAAASWPA
jgi:hypothetical protein